MTFQEKEHEFQLWDGDSCVWKTSRIFVHLDEAMENLENSKHRCRIIEVTRKVHVVSEEGEPK